MIKEYSFLPLNGPVKMANPDITLALIARIRDENNREDDGVEEEWYFGKLVTSVMAKRS